MRIVPFAYQDGKKKTKFSTVGLAPFHFPEINFLCEFICLLLLHKMSNFDIFDPNLFELTPPELSIIAQNASENIIPEKSKGRYISAYDAFIAWREDKKANSFSENVMLAYFSELSAKLKPSTLWSRFSMLKSMLKIKNDVDISKYPKLNAFIKRQSDGFTSKKSKILTSNEVERFLNEAPDDRYLATKVIS